ncbi:hypothetical protein FBUS_03611 [Fasciolopsis buskii]|uniref:G-protein coupled receptors family 1 profile domain-containing protein n=1 Tax=Fasciolopsis buskii TaxID=27845 RepID=A0A8E0VGZ7_9TREM|nr:hypothetical protein FBUS_03611 [Fasciolopsis buski]
MACFTVIVQIGITNDLHIQPGHDSFFFCFIIESGFFRRFFRVLVLANTICLPINRFWAVIYPSTYRQRTTWYIVFCYTFILVYSLASSLSRALAVNLCEGVCILDNSPTGEVALQIVDLILRYIFPLSVIGSLHTLVIMRVCRLQREENARQEEQRQQLPNHDSQSYARVGRNLSISTLGFTAEMLVLEVIALVFNLMQTAGVVDFRPDSIGRLIYVYLCSLASAINPALAIATVPPLRETIIEILNEWTTFIRGVLRRCRWK